ncbi:MAG: hypothetical protein ACXVQR_00855 [Solirubrobacteraceae bacterium]
MSDEPTLPSEDPTEVAPATAPDQPVQTTPSEPESVALPPSEPTSFTPPEPVASQAAAAAPPRPEVAVGAAFAGGFLAALILKRLAR